MKNTTPSLASLARALTLAAVLAPASLFAQAYPTWQGTGTNWSTPANWNVALAYGQLQWTGGGNATSWNDNPSGTDMWRFYFEGSQSYTLGGNAVNFFDFGGTNGGILSGSSVLQTINMNLSFRDNGVRPMGILTTNSGGLTFNGQIQLTNSMTFLGIMGTNTASDITFNGSIVGNKGVVIGTNTFASNGLNGTATRAFFNGSNSYSGTTEIRRGTLFITNGNALSTNNVVMALANNSNNILATLQVNGTTTAGNTFAFADGGSNASINVSNAAAFTITGNLINESGANAGTKFGKTGAGTLILAGTASTYAGQMQIGNGTVIIGNSSALSTNITTANRGIDIGLNVRDVNQANTVTLLLSNGVTLSNSIYVAPNTVSSVDYARTIGISGSGSATISNQIFLGGNLTFDIGAGNNITSANAPSGSVFTSTGGLIKIGDGTLTLAGNSDYTGKTVLAGGRTFMTGANDLRFGAAPASFTADSLTISNGAFLTTSNSSSVALTWNGNRGITIGAGGGLWQITANVDVISGGTNFLSGSGSLLKYGSGTLTLAHSNSFSGDMISTNAFAGTLNINHQFALANSTLIRTTVTSGTSVLNFGSVGGTNFNLGGLAASAAGTGSDIALTNTAGAAINLTVGANNQNTTYAAVLSQAGSLTKVGSGTLSLTGLNTFTGNLTVSDGRVSLFRTTSNAMTAQNIIINGGRLFQVSGGGNANHLITNTANMQISSGSYNLQFLNQNLAQLEMSGGNMNITDFAVAQFSGASSVTGGTIETAGGQSRVYFNNGLALGGATFSYNSSTNASGTTVRLTNTVTYAATNTVAASFNNAAAGIGNLELGGSTGGVATNTFDIADAGSVASEVNINWNVVGTAALRKIGNGVLTLGGAGTNTYSGNTVVTGGTLALNKTAGVTAIAGNVEVGGTGKLLISASNQVADSSAVTLSGGTIERGSGVSETFGNLNLTADSFLDYGTGAIGTLTFGTYSPVSKLSINNFLIGNVLRFTTDLSGSINNTSLFAFDNGFVSDWNTTTPGFFTITAIPEPSTVLAAAALGGLMLWSPLRRRFARKR